MKNYNDGILSEYCLIYQESQKYIKNTDYDKYSRLLNYSEINKYIIEQDRLQFYKKYKPNTDIEKIKGNYSPKMMNEAIDEYVALNYTKKVKPLLTQRDGKGKIKYTPERATKEVKSILKKMYL